jgi:hypothetical protein
MALHEGLADGQGDHQIGMMRGGFWRETDSSMPFGPEVVYGHGRHLVSILASARYNETRRRPNIDISPIIPLRVTGCVRSRGEVNTNLRPSVQVAAKIMGLHPRQLHRVGRECGIEECGIGEGRGPKPKRGWKKTPMIKVVWRQQQN